MEIQKFKKDLLTVVFLAILTFSLFTFTQHNYLHQSSYEHALKIKKSLDGQETGLYYQTIAFVFRALEPIMGNTNSALTSVLFLVPVFLSILIAVSVYLILRGIFPIEVSFVSSLLFVFLQPFIGLGSNGLLSPAPLFFLTSILAVLFFLSSIRINKILAIPGGFLLAISINFSLGLLLAIAILLAILLQIVYNYLTYKEFKSLLYSFGITCLIFIVTSFFLGYGKMNLSIDLFTPFVNYFLVIPFLVSGIIVLLMGQRNDYDIFIIVLLLSSFIIAAYGQLYLAMLGFVFGIANFFTKLNEIKGKEYYIDWLFLAVVYFLILLKFLTVQQSLMVSLLLGIVSTFLVKLYEDKFPSKYVTYGLIVFAFLSLAYNSVTLIQISYAEPSSELYNSMLWIKTNTPKNAFIATTENSYAVEFVAERKSGNYTNLISTYLSGNYSTSILKNENISYLFLLNPFRQSGIIPTKDMEVFAFNSNVGLSNIEQCSFRCAFFVSQISSTDLSNLICGRDMSCLLIPVDSSNIPTGAPTLLFTKLEQTSIPYGKLVFLKKNESSQFSPLDLAIYPKNTNSNILKIYLPESFGNINGIKKVYSSPSNDIIILKVEGAN